MTMPPAGGKQPLWTKPPSGYWYSHLGHAKQREAMRRGRELVAKEFDQQVRFGIKTYARKEPDVEKRKMGFRRKPVFLWVGQRVYFPRFFEEDWAEWERIDPVPEAVALRASIIGEIEAQSSALQQQLLLQEAQARMAPPAPAAQPAQPQGEGPWTSAPTPTTP